MPDARGLKFLESHEWARQQGDEATVGISDYAQSQLGDVIYLELPRVGQRLEAGGKFGVVESVKAASDVYSPLSGEVAEVNEQLKDHPEWVNEDPYGKGWILKLKGTAANPKLLDEAAYAKHVEGEEH